MSKAWLIGGTWVAGSVKPLTLDLGSGPDLMVPEIESRFGFSADCTEPAWDSLSLSLCHFSLSLKINKHRQKKCDLFTKRHVPSTCLSVIFPDTRISTVSEPILNADWFGNRQGICLYKNIPSIQKIITSATVRDALSILQRTWNMLDKSTGCV